MAVKGNKLTPRCREAEVAEKVRLGAVCSASTSQIRQKDLDDNLGQYPIYGASGVIKFVDFYQIESEGLGIVKDGAGVGRVMRLPSFSSVIGTVMIIRPQAGVDCGYLFYALAKQNLGALCTGATIPHLYFKDFKDRKIKLLSLPAQRRIAAELDKICELKKNAETRLEKLDLLVKSRFVEMFGDPMTNPKGWHIGKVSDLAKYWNGLTYKPENVSETGTIVLRSSNIQGGRLDFADTVRVNISAKEKNVVVPGDVLMCSRNGSAALVGKTAIIQVTDERMYFGAFMMIIRSTVPEYLNAYFSTKAFRSQITCGATSTVNQITCTMMDRVSLPIPPMDLMREFAAFVEKVDKLAVNVRETVAKMDVLYRSKLQEYFG